MDRSFSEQGQGSGSQQHPKRSWVSVTILASIIKWLAGLINLTEEEQKEAGIYLGPMRGE